LLFPVTTSHGLADARMELVASYPLAAQTPMTFPAPSKKRERDFWERECDFPDSCDFAQTDSFPRLTDALMTEDAVRGAGLMPQPPSIVAAPNRDQVDTNAQSVAMAAGRRLQRARSLILWCTRRIRGRDLVRCAANLPLIGPFPGR